MAAWIEAGPPRFWMSFRLRPACAAAVRLTWQQVVEVEPREPNRGAGGVPGLSERGPGESAAALADEHRLVRRGEGPEVLVEDVTPAAQEGDDAVLARLRLGEPAVEIGRLRDRQVPGTVVVGDVEPEQLTEAQGRGEGHLDRHPVLRRDRAQHPVDVGNGVLRSRRRDVLPAAAVEEQLIEKQPCAIKSADRRSRTPSSARA